MRGRFGDSLTMAEAALAISRTVGDEVAEARALNALGLDLACRSDFDRSIPLLREANAESVRLGDPVAIFLSAVGLGWALDEMALHAESLELALSTRERLRDLGAEARFGGQLASKAARALYELGRWDEASALLDETIASGPTRYALRWLLSNRIRLRVGRGDLAGARVDVATYDSLGERVIGPDPDSLHARRADLAIVAGEPLTARELVRETLGRLTEPDLDTEGRALTILGLRAEVGEAEAARARRDRASEAAAISRAAQLQSWLLRYASRVAQATAVPARVITADRALGVALFARVRNAHEIEAWVQAVSERRAVGRPFELAQALESSALAHLALRRREDGASALAEAHTIAVELGAEPLRDRLEALARRARIGLEGVDTAEDAADRLGLTRREREVLRLLADGRSNRQIGEQLFMAESTAGVHVSNILSKLGVSRRHEAAAMADRLGIGAA